MALNNASFNRGSGAARYESFKTAVDNRNVLQDATATPNTGAAVTLTIPGTPASKTQSPRAN